MPLLEPITNLLPWDVSSFRKINRLKPYGVTKRGYINAHMNKFISNASCCGIDDNS